MVINFDDIRDVKKALLKEQNNLLRIKIKIKQLQQVIQAHRDGLYNPKLFEELMKRTKEV